MQGRPVSPWLSWFLATEASRSSGGRLAVPAEGPWCWPYSLRHLGFTQTPWSSGQARHLHRLGEEVAVWGCPGTGGQGLLEGLAPAPSRKPMRSLEVWPVRAVSEGLGDTSGDQCTELVLVGGPPAGDLGKGPVGQLGRSQQGVGKLAQGRGCGRDRPARATSFLLLTHQEMLALTPLPLSLLSPGPWGLLAWGPWGSAQQKTEASWAWSPGGGESRPGWPEVQGTKGHRV